MASALSLKALIPVSSCQSIRNIGSTRWKMEETRLVLTSSRRSLSQPNSTLSCKRFTKTPKWAVWIACKKRIPFTKMIIWFYQIVTEKKAAKTWKSLRWTLNSKNYSIKKHKLLNLTYLWIRVLRLKVLQTTTRLDLVVSPISNATSNSKTRLRHLAGVTKAKPRVKGKRIGLKLKSNWRLKTRSCLWVKVHLWL